MPFNKRNTCFASLYKTGNQIKTLAVVKVSAVFYCLGRTVCASCGAGKRTHTVAWCRRLVLCLHVYCISAWACMPCICVCVCVCGNYSNLNAGSAGETGCLLINEQSRWSWVGGSCECTSESVRWSEHRRHLGHRTNKTHSSGPPVSTSLFVRFVRSPSSGECWIWCDKEEYHHSMKLIWSYTKHI